MDVTTSTVSDSPRGAHFRAFLTFAPWIGMVLVGALAAASISTLRVTRRHHQSVVQGMDLIADVYPPRAHLLEALLNAFQLVEQTDPAALRDLLATARRIGGDFKSHHNFWMRALPEGELKTALFERSYAAGAEFLAARDRDFIPLVLAGKRVEARRLLDTVLQDSYARHQRAVETVLGTAFAHKTSLEKQGTDQARRLRAGAVALGVFVAAAVIAAALLVGRRDRWPALPTRGVESGARFTN